MAGHTLLLDNQWDITLDGNGNIATTSGDYGVAQGVANSIRLFTNDAYYDPDKGVPHFAIDLKKAPQESVIRARLLQAALETAGVKAAKIESLAIVNRHLTGNIQLATEFGGADVAF